MYTIRNFQFATTVGCVLSVVPENLDVESSFNSNSARV